MAWKIINFFPYFCHVQANGGNDITPAIKLLDFTDGNKTILV